MTSPDPFTGWIGIGAFARKHGVHAETVRRAVKRGDLAARMVGSFLYLHEDTPYVARKRGRPRK